MILCIENHKDSTKEFLEAINKYSKAAGYKINVQTSATFLCTNNEISEKEKYLGINSTTDMKDLYMENYKALLKDAGKNTMNVPSSRMEESAQLKWLSFPACSTLSTFPLLCL